MQRWRGKCSQAEVDDLSGLCLHRLLLLLLVNLLLPGNVPNSLVPIGPIGPIGLSLCLVHLFVNLKVLMSPFPPWTEEGRQATRAGQASSHPPRGKSNGHNSGNDPGNLQAVHDPVLHILLLCSDLLDRLCQILAQLLHQRQRGTVRVLSCGGRRLRPSRLLQNYWSMLKISGPEVWLNPGFLDCSLVGFSFT